MSEQFTGSSSFMILTLHTAFKPCGDWGAWLYLNASGMMLHCLFLNDTLKSYPWSLMTQLVSLDWVPGWFKNHVSAAWLAITFSALLSNLILQHVLPSLSLVLVLPQCLYCLNLSVLWMASWNWVVSELVHTKVLFCFQMTFWYSAFTQLNLTSSYFKAMVVLLEKSDKMLAHSC